MQKREGDRERGVMLREEHAGLGRRQRETGKEERCSERGINGYAEERGRQGRIHDFMQRTCVVMQK
jgi:hypothetical protein